MISMKDNFFFEGVVEDIEDPLKIGRVRVRIIGIHSDNKSKLPTDYLPWAGVLIPITSASISGVGQSPVGIVRGTMVFGIFRDPGSFQEPFILGTVGGFRETYMNSTFGFNDPSGEYPKSGIEGDVNKLAGGAADTPAGKALRSNFMDVTIEGATDPIKGD